MVWLLLVNLFISVYSSGDESFSLSRVDIKTLSHSDKEMLEDMGIVYLEKLVLPNNIDVSFERLYGYTDLRENSVGVCVYHRYIFSGEKLSVAKVASERYVGSAGFGCNNRLDGHFAIVKNVPDKIASLILSSFEKNSDDLTKFKQIGVKS